MYQTLYRKYRPKDFNQVVGQDVIVKTLKNSIKNGKVSHAYMFFGPRGVGKTSIAKIFARTINCNNQDGNICNNCNACISSSNKECLDIIEIDAASNNGVDEIRELRDKVSLVPSELKYKIYIIDEVHMLTIQAFNALLKTLEEPPSHVIFILATTDPQKVPETIVSRCQCFSFNRISNNDIVLNLKKICDAENIDVSDDVLFKISEFSNGGMRDSIGMLDKLYAYSDDKITMEDFIKLNRIVSNEDIFNLIQFIDNNQIDEVVNLINEWDSNGINIIQIMDSILEFLKNIILSILKGENSKFSSVDKLIDLANLINEKMFDLKKSNSPKIYIQILFLNFMNNYQNISRNISREIFSASNDNSDLIKPKVFEKKSEKETVVTDGDNNPKMEKVVSILEKSQDEVNKDTKVLGNNLENSNIIDIMMIRLNNTLAEADKAELLKDKNCFEKLNDFVFDQNIGYLVCSLMDGTLRVSSKKNIILSYEYDSIVKDNLCHLDEFNKILNEKLGLNKKIGIVTDLVWEKEKANYISKIKNNDKYTYVEEPDLVYNKDVTSTTENVDDNSIGIFGDIVEVE
ncbi:MAG: DNA polymerase III subunit gamma/tau [Bacilli bacterium]|nr:DNA polymerase III subunit gamma/tau [Bacilli bacterium]